jgi:hypothetical protein
MATSYFQQVLRDVTSPSLKRNEALRWCRLVGRSTSGRLPQALKPARDQALSAGMQLHWAHAYRSRLRMNGRAAENVLASYRSFG